jgi:hypothetical protein
MSNKERPERATPVDPRGAIDVVTYRVDTGLTCHYNR